MLLCMVVFVGWRPLLVVFLLFDVACNFLFVCDCAHALRWCYYCSTGIKSHRAFFCSAFDMASEDVWDVWDEEDRCNMPSAWPQPFACWKEHHGYPKASETSERNIEGVMCTMCSYDTAHDSSPSAMWNIDSNTGGIVNSATIRNLILICLGIGSWA